MPGKIIRCFLLVTIVLVAIITTGCGIHYNVKGRVVDATTGEPIEGASVAIRWMGTKISGCIAPYASGDYTIKRAKGESDKDGYFTIPKYLLKSCYMGVYKEGYVCWSNRHIFLQGEPRKKVDQFRVRTYRTKDRPWFHVRNGMVIELEPFTATDSQIILRHAQFTYSTSNTVEYLSGIGKEVGIVMEDKRRRKEEHDNKMKERKTGTTK
jgi:hypothetical protein